MCVQYSWCCWGGLFEICQSWVNVLFIPFPCNDAGMFGVVDAVHAVVVVTTVAAVVTVAATTAVAVVGGAAAAPAAVCTDDK